MYGNYNFGLPSYNLPYQQAQQMQLQNMQQFQQPEAVNNNGINWGTEADARACFVEPGKSKLIMDVEKSLFYIKTVDDSGMPRALRRFKYSEVLDNAPVVVPEASDAVEYVTKKEFEEFVAQLNADKKSRKKEIINESVSGT